MEGSGCETPPFAENNAGDSLRIAMQPPTQVASVRGVAALVAPWRPVSLQFLGSLQKILVNRTPDEFRHRSARLVGQHL